MKEMDIKQKIEDMNRAKRFSGSNREIERYAYFPRFDGQHRTVILKPTSNMKEPTVVYSVPLIPKKYTACSGHIATRILNDFPEFVEAVASTMMQTEDREYMGTYYVEKEKIISRVTGKTSYKYTPVLVNGVPKVFDMADLGLKSFAELEEEREQTKIDIEYEKLKKNIGMKAKAKAKLEAELGTTIDDSLVEESDIKEKTKKGKK